MSGILTQKLVENPNPTYAEMVGWTFSITTVAPEAIWAMVYDIGSEFAHQARAQNDLAVRSDRRWHMVTSLIECSGCDNFKHIRWDILGTGRGKGREQRGLGTWVLAYCSRHGVGAAVRCRVFCVPGIQAIEIVLFSMFYASRR